MSTDATMEPESLLSSLAAAGVVHDDGDAVTLTESYRQRRSDAREALAGGENPVSEAVETALRGAATAVDTELRATAAAIADATDLEPEAVAAAALALGRVEEPPPASGAPDGFTPIRGEEIAAFLQRHPTAVVYVWGDDCEPCDAVRADFESLQETSDLLDSVGLAAVHGGQCQELLRERFDVTVAPTTLFCTDGRVDARLIGAHQEQTLVSEIEIIVEG